MYRRSNPSAYLGLTRGGGGWSSPSQPLRRSSTPALSLSRDIILKFNSHCRSLILWPPNLAPPTNRMRRRRRAFLPLHCSLRSFQSAFCILIVFFLPLRANTSSSKALSNLVYSLGEYIFSCPPDRSGEKSRLGRAPIGIFALTLAWQLAGTNADVIFQSGRCHWLAAPQVSLSDVSADGRTHRARLIWTVDPWLRVCHKSVRPSVGQMGEQS